MCYIARIMTEVEANGMLMDAKFFENILRLKLGEESVINVMIKDRSPVVGKGENFLSNMCRITLSYSWRKKSCNTTESVQGMIQKKISLVVKNEPEQEGPCLSLVQDQNLFETENRMLSHILPKIEALLGKPISPKCLFANEINKGPSLIVLEDLKPLGFVTKNRLPGLPMAHVRMVLESLANLHAASVYLYEQDPNIMKPFNEGIMSEKTPQNMFRVLEQTMRMVSEECKKWPSAHYRIIGDKLRRLEDRFAEEIVGVVNYDDGEFCVLNHGDCWVNNIMFREDQNGNPCEIRLIDFQMSVYTSPVIDLVYFLSICPSIDIRDKHDEFLDNYLQMLRRTMSTLKCRTRPPTIEDLQRAIVKRRMWAILAALTFYPRMIADSTEVETFDALVGSGKTRMKIFKNPIATEILQKSVLFMDERGYFD